MKTVALIIGAAMLQVGIVGCGTESDRPDLGEVSGIVTLDGKPLPHANISFRPIEGGRVAQAQADADGFYDLIYLDNPYVVRGAKVGENVVYVSTYVEGEDDVEPSPELVPECYRTRDSVKHVEVEEGSNEINLVLSSQCD